MLENLDSGSAGSLNDPHDAPATTSKFTATHLSLLRESSTASPLRTVALIDFDAFYAQCEMVRLGLPSDQPFGVQQWKAIIAFNYAARACGLQRGISVKDAKQRCPGLLLQHVATWRAGARTWAYHPDVEQHFHSDKAALDPYRNESRKAFAVVQETLPSELRIPVEKASVDEMFLDVSVYVHSILLERYPFLEASVKGSSLPLPSQRGLDWSGSHVVGGKGSPFDWDDLALNIAAEIVAYLRNRIREQLGYTTSAGVARNKMLAKLSASFRKPDSQTVLRSDVTADFLADLQFKKIRGLGGSLGDQVRETFGGTTVADLLPVPVSSMVSKLGPAKGNWVYSTLRGSDDSEVISRVMVRSLLSQKTFVPNLSNLEEAATWLRIFAADLHGRILDLDTPRSSLRPKTLTVYHHPKGRFGPTYTKQTTLPPASKFSETAIFDISLAQLRALTSKRHSWPCAALGVRLSGLVVVESAVSSVLATFRTDLTGPAARDSAANEVRTLPKKSDGGIKTATVPVPFNLSSPTGPDSSGVHPLTSRSSHSRPTPSDEAGAQGLYRCPYCPSKIAEDNVLEHLDWHAALELSASFREPQ